MGLIRTGIVTIAAFLAMAVGVTASDLTLSGNARWIVIASRIDFDEAVGIARCHRWELPSVRVVRAVNGWFAVVAGPEAASTPRALRERLSQRGNLPKDFLLSRGENYVEQVWAPRPSPVAGTVSYDGRSDASMRLGELSVVVSSVVAKGTTERHPIAVGRREGRVAFAMSLDKSTLDGSDAARSDFAVLQAIRLDPTSPRPQVVLTSFWGGAHCCTVTQIASEDPRTGRWLVRDGETLDGGGYGFEDLDGDGVAELVSSDNSFLYAFAPYASSNAPTRIGRVRGGAIEDATTDPTFAPYQRQMLARMEHSANLDPERWHDNGFLAGWVAQSALVGRREAAWSRMLALYNRNDEWTLEECTIDRPLATCPEGRKRKIDFPTALRRHLDEHGYGTAAGVARAFSGEASFEDASSRFDQLSVDDRIAMQVRLTATGDWIAVPTARLTKTLFEALKRYQQRTSKPATGMLDETERGALSVEAEPLLRRWSFAAIEHPTRGHPIWVPLGLGLQAERTATGVSWSDPAQRVRMTYGALPGTVESVYRSTLDRFASQGAAVEYKIARPDFFVVSARGADGLDWYVRLHRDGADLLGVFLTWKHEAIDLHMDRAVVLVSGSLWASMTGAAFTSPPIIAPPPAVAITRPSPPAVPTPPAIAPRPPVEAAPHESSSGTGFFVSREGHVRTNAHVAGSCQGVELSGPNGLVPAHLVAKDAVNDLALLKTEITPVKVAALRRSVRLGEPVAVFGYPLSGVLSTSGNFTLGNVTALTGLQDDSRYLQISAPVQPGNSGGPLVDGNGNFIGIVTAKLNALKMMIATNGDIPQNVNFAIKSAVVSTFLESNGINVAAGTETTAMAPADLADHAKSMSVHVFCHSAY